MAYLTISLSCFKAVTKALPQSVAINRLNRAKLGKIFEIIHDQLPLAVPCYDLVPVIEFTLGRNQYGLWVLPTPLT